MIKLGIIGTSKLLNHFFYIDKKKFEICGIYGRNKKKLEHFSKKFNCKYFLEYNSLIKNKEIDLIYINLPDYLHYKYILNSIQNNKHVICEKSFGINEDEIIKLVKLANLKNKYLFESFMYFYHEQYFYLKKIINKNQYGKLLNINFINFGILKDQNNYRLKKSTKGHILNDIGCYAIHLFLNLTNFQIKESYSYFGKKKEEEVFTSGMINLTSANNFYLNGQFSYNLPENNLLTLNFEKAIITSKNYITTKPRTIIKIKYFKINEYFKNITRYKLINKIINKIFIKYKKNYKEKKVVIISENPYKKMFNSFFDIISQKHNIEINNSKILEQAKIMERVRRSD